MGAFEKCKSELDIDQPSCLLSSLTSYVPTLWELTFWELSFWELTFWEEPEAFITHTHVHNE